MILSSFMFLPNNLKFSRLPIVYNNNFLDPLQTYRSVRKKNCLLSYVVNDLEYFSSKEKLAKKEFINSSRWRDLVNSHWKQTVFLSLSDKLSDQYIAQLNSLNISRDKSQHKRLISQFSKSLNNLSIDVTSISSSLKIDQNRSSHIEYIWLKKLYFNPLNLFNIFQYNKEITYFNKVRKWLNNQISFSCLPLYVVSNHLGQIVVSEPPQNTVNENVGHILLNKNNLRNVHQSWFFVNFQDAQEYMEYIKKFYSLNTENYSLKIFTCDLETFYQISSKYNKSLNLRLVPDLQEISNLLNHYRYKHNINFHSKQQYGSDYFQGQPLYMVESLEISEGSYPISLGNTSKKYNIVFTNYNTALSFWHVIQQKALSKNYINKPKLIVYNLENFLKDNLNYFVQKNNRSELLVVPSEESYKYAKQKYDGEKYPLVYRDCFNVFLNWKLWAKRVLWSLTSKQPKYD